MRIGISGGTGLVGAALCRKWAEDGNELVLFGRNRQSVKSVWPLARFVEWSAESGLMADSLPSAFDAFVHLAGEPIASRRWTEERKNLILQSRVTGTRRLIEAFRSSKIVPGVLISASAVGFYGDRGDEELDETSSAGTGFLSEVAVRWEEEARRACELGSRVVLLRTGIVLSTKGGALSKMLLPFRLGLGGRLGHGRQFMSWIHLADQIRLIDFALKHESVEGALNSTAPNPVRNVDFTHELGRILKRPTPFPVPAFVLRLALGEMAGALLLEGQRVLPRKATSAGFTFLHPELSGALSDLVA